MNCFRYIDIKIEHLWVYDCVEMWHRKGPADCYERCRVSLWSGVSSEFCEPASWLPCRWGHCHRVDQALWGPPVTSLGHLKSSPRLFCLNSISMFALFTLPRRWQVWKWVCPLVHYPQIWIAKPCTLLELIYWVNLYNWCHVLLL